MSNKATLLEKDIWAHLSPLYKQQINTWLRRTFGNRKNGSRADVFSEMIIAAEEILKDES